MKANDIIYYDPENPDWYKENVADFCNTNNCEVVEIDPIDREVDEIYLTEEDGQLVEKTRKVIKSFRRFKIQEIVVPEKTQEDVDANKAYEYSQKTDPLISEYIRKQLLGTLTEERKAQIEQELAQITKEIKEQNPDIE